MAYAIFLTLTVYNFKFMHKLISTFTNAGQPTAPHVQIRNVLFSDNHGSIGRQVASQVGPGYETSGHNNYGAAIAVSMRALFKDMCHHEITNW